MPSVKKNIGWNILLTVSGYLFPLLTFPYVTRVLGADNLGLANFALSVVDYAILFSTMGIVSIGYRYIPQCNDDEKKRSYIFSRLVSLHLIMSLVVLVIYTLCIFLIPQLLEHKVLYFVGVTKILMNVFLVDWLFKGMQDLRYITLRSLLIRFLYVISIFVFVRGGDDYDLYFYISIAQVIVNAVVNWRFSKKYVKFSFSLKGCQEYVFPVFSMGITQILFSFYGTFNIIYLGMKCDDAAVGYFVTATKLYSIFLSFLNAYNGAFVPYMNSLFGKGEMEQFKKYVGYSFNIVILLSLPLIIGGVFLAPEIIRLIAGSGYERAILPFQIVMVQVLLVGIAQILENQILLSFKKFKEVLICTSISTILAAMIIIVFVSSYAEVASAYAVAIPHIIEVLLLYYYTQKTISIKFPIGGLVKDLIICAPIVLICMISKKLWDNYMMILIVAVSLSVIYYFIVQFFFLKNEFLISQTSQLTQRINSFIKRNE